MQYMQHISISEVKEGEEYLRPNNQRTLHRRPESKMSPILAHRQLPIAHLQHVGVRIAPEVRGVEVEAVLVEEGGYSTILSYIHISSYIYHVSSFILISYIHTYLCMCMYRERGREENKPVISPLTLHEFPVSFPQIPTSACPHTQSE